MKVLCWLLVSFDKSGADPYIVTDLRLRGGRKCSAHCTWWYYVGQKFFQREILRAIETFGNLFGIFMSIVVFYMGSLLFQSTGTQVCLNLYRQFEFDVPYLFLSSIWFDGFIRPPNLPFTDTDFRGQRTRACETWAFARDRGAWRVDWKVVRCFLQCYFILMMSDGRL